MVICFEYSKILSRFFILLFFFFHLKYYPYLCNVEPPKPLRNAQIGRSIYFKRPVNCCWQAFFTSKYKTRNSWKP